MLPRLRRLALNRQVRIYWGRGRLFRRRRRGLLSRRRCRNQYRPAGAFLEAVQPGAEPGRFRGQPIDRRNVALQPARLDNGQRQIGGWFVMGWSGRTASPRRNRRGDRILAEQRRDGPAEMIAAGVEADRTAPAHKVLGQLAQRRLGPGHRRLGRATPIVGRDLRWRGGEGKIVHPPVRQGRAAGVGCPSRSHRLVQPWALAGARSSALPEAAGDAVFAGGKRKARPAARARWLRDEA